MSILPGGTGEGFEREVLLSSQRVRHWTGKIELGEQELIRQPGALETFVGIAEQWLLPGLVQG